MDYDFLNSTDETVYFNFTILAGSTKNVPLTFIDDSVAERYYEASVYFVGIYESGQQLDCDFGYIFIDDNDGI